MELSLARFATNAPVCLVVITPFLESATSVYLQTSKSDPVYTTTYVDAVERSY